MFFSFKKSYKTSGLLEGFTDWHSHILPGVDDGIKTMEEAVAVLEYYESLGMEEVWLTPHIMEDIPNTSDNLRKGYDTLCRNYKGKIRLHLAAEYMLDTLFIDRLGKGDILTYDKSGKQILVETSYVQAPYGFHNILQDMKEAGFIPVLAHPERYRYMNWNDYQTLHSQGIRFQLNIMSLIGAYGPAAQSKASGLLEEGFYTYSGTDVHSLASATLLMEKKSLQKSKIELLENLLYQS